MCVFANYLFFFFLEDHKLLPIMDKQFSVVGVVSMKFRKALLNCTALDR